MFLPISVLERNSYLNYLNYIASTRKSKDGLRATIEFSRLLRIMPHVMQLRNAAECIKLSPCKSKVFFNTSIFLVLLKITYIEDECKIHVVLVRMLASVTNKIPHVHILTI